jgi:hypothetical protein
VNADWSNFFSALAGGAIAGVFTLWAQLLNAKDQRRREDKAEEILIHGFLQAIADELESVWHRYEVEIGPHLKNLGEDQAAVVFPVHQNYFIVFDSSASLIGRIHNIELRERIISTYVEAKGLVDSLHYYERLVEEYNAIPQSSPIADSISGVTHFPINSAATRKFSELVEYTKALKEAHSRLEDKVFRVQAALRAYLNG